MNEIAFPPPPPDIFSNDADFNIPDLVKASPVPLAVPSQPPPAPPGMMKCNLSTAKDDEGAEIAIAKTDRVANNRLNNLSIYPPFVC